MTTFTPNTEGVFRGLPAADFNDKESWCDLVNVPMKQEGEGL